MDACTHQILGSTLSCAESNEVINTATMAMRAKMDFRVLRDTIFTHPSVSEVLNDLFALLPAKEKGEETLLQVWRASENAA